MSFASYSLCYAALWVLESCVMRPKQQSDRLLAALTLRLQKHETKFNANPEDLHAFVKASQHFHGGSSDSLFERKPDVFCNQNARFVNTRFHLSRKRSQVSRDEGLGPPINLVSSS